MDWDQIRALHRAGHEIGSHTHTHRPLTGLDDAEALSEMRRSREVLEERLGATGPLFLAYPRGAYLPRHQALAREAGYAGACAVILRWGDLLGRSDRYALKRMTIKGTEPLWRFCWRLRLCSVVRYGGR
jgi:peptidoglycan/xylan/chitin deacetylase (PgdA/CDA1 family)